LINNNVISCYNEFILKKDTEVRKGIDDNGLELVKNEIIKY